MIEITRHEFWGIATLIERNYHLKDFGSTWMSGDNDGIIYKTNLTNEVILKSKRMGRKIKYFADKKLVEILKQTAIQKEE